MTTVPDTLAALARRQAGAFSRAQALGAGVSPSGIARRVASAEWRPVFPRVYRNALTPLTPLLRWHAALLYGGDGACLSHLTAATILEIDVRAGPLPVWVTLPASRCLRPPGDIVMTRSALLGPRSIAQRRGLQVTSAARTLLDLAQVCGARHLAGALDDAVRRGLGGPARLRAELDHAGRRPGTGLLRRVLDEWDPQRESVLEAELGAVLRRAGLPPGRTQYVVRDVSCFVARLDLAYPEVRLAVEVDGYRWHSSRERHEADRRRDRALARLGWLVLRVTADDLRRLPDTVVRDIDHHLAARTALLPGRRQGHAEAVVPATGTVASA